MFQNKKMKCHDTTLKPIPSSYLIDIYFSNFTPFFAISLTSTMVGASTALVVLTALLFSTAPVMAISLSIGIGIGIGAAFLTGFGLSLYAHSEKDDLPQEPSFSF